MPLASRLVLNDWLLRRIGATSFGQVRSLLETAEAREGQYIDAIVQGTDAELRESDELLRGYDARIERVTQVLQTARGAEFEWTYYQYLALLLTEIYLDWQLRRAPGFIASLNEHLEQFQAEFPARMRAAPFAEDELSRVAVWSATGSGKTLVMHANLLQYTALLKDLGKPPMSRVLLLTPNAGLSNQHLEELRRSGIAASAFDKSAGDLWSRHSVQIIDIHKLRDVGKHKTVSVEELEGNNLVLIDEGHRGTSGDEWRRMRDKVCRGGFAFEYSATFGQAVATRKELAAQYGKSIILDYSYRHFYEDGYGKDFRVLNLAGSVDEVGRRKYLTACLLTYYQQLRYFDEQSEAVRTFQFSRPLLVFVGRSVLRPGPKDLSDVMEILAFLSEFLSEPTTAVGDIAALLSGTAGLLSGDSEELFAGAFEYLSEQGVGEQDVYDDLLQRVFKVGHPGKLRADLLRGASGEISLRVGQAAPFGVINIGDAPKLAKQLEDASFEIGVGTQLFASSLFSTINDQHSPVNLLVGAKKFLEGWNTWRVSTMGLMNLGRSEGSEIVQMFGRGVRLRGFEGRLKRSSYVLNAEPPDHVEVLETLNVFGVRADYIKQFEEYLRVEGVVAAANKQHRTLKARVLLPGVPLRIVRRRPCADFERECRPSPRLGVPPDGEPFVHLDCYPRVHARISQEIGREGSVAFEKTTSHFTPRHLEYMDLRRIYGRLLERKHTRGQLNLEIPEDCVASLLSDTSWYSLAIPAEELAFRDYARVHRWEEIATDLLGKFCERFYRLEKAAWEATQLQYAELEPNDENFRFIADCGGHKLSFPAKEHQTFKELSAWAAKAGAGEDFESERLRGLDVPFHLYSPLLALSRGDWRVVPTSLNRGEAEFIADLRSFWSARSSEFQDKELYLLRNQGRGRGVSFFTAQNFHPDFILWLVERGGRQYVTFADPKGIIHLYGAHHPKIQLATKIKEIEKELGDPNTVLNSFILSNTRFSDVCNWGLTKSALNDLHVLFQQDDRDSYIADMFSRVLGTGAH